MSWEDQGRQYHMWFGHGTAPDKGMKSSPDPSVTGKSTSDRVLALAYGAIAAFPASLRGRVEGQYQHGTLPRLKEAKIARSRRVPLIQAVIASFRRGRVPCWYCASARPRRDIGRAAIAP